MTKNRDQTSRPDDDRLADNPTPVQGTWIIRPSRRRGRSPVQRELPLDDAGSRRRRGDDVDPDGLGDEQFRRLLLDDTDDIELGDLASVEDDQPMTAEERAGLDRALQALVQALEQAIDEMIPDDEDADDQHDARDDVG